MTKNARQRGKVGERGFTLVEMIVAVALFSVVMLVSVGTLLALVGANRKAQALQSVMSNLNIALDSMVRSIRMGSVYHCGGGNYTVPADCANGGTTFAFKPFGVSSAPTVYRFNGTRIERSENGGSFIGITAPEVSIDITSSRFYVVGTTRGAADAANVQPKVVIVLKGTAGAGSLKTSTTFSIQATAVQRVLDI